MEIKELSLDEIDISEFNTRKDLEYLSKAEEEVFIE